MGMILNFIPLLSILNIFAREDSKADEGKSGKSSKKESKVGTLEVDVKDSNPKSGYVYVKIDEDTQIHEVLFAVYKPKNKSDNKKSKGDDKDSKSKDASNGDDSKKSDDSGDFSKITLTKVEHTEVKKLEKNEYFEKNDGGSMVLVVSNKSFSEDTLKVVHVTGKVKKSESDDKTDAKSKAGKDSSTKKLFTKKGITVDKNDKVTLMSVKD